MRLAVRGHDDRLAISRLLDGLAATCTSLGVENTVDTPTPTTPSPTIKTPSSTTMKPTATNTKNATTTSDESAPTPSSSGYSSQGSEPIATRPSAKTIDAASSQPDSNGSLPTEPSSTTPLPSSPQSQPTDSIDETTAPTPTPKLADPEIVRTTESSASATSTGIAVGTIVSAIVLAIALFWFYRRRRQKISHNVKSENESPVETGRSRAENSDFTSLGSSAPTGDASESPHRIRALLAQKELSHLLKPLITWQIDSRELRDVDLIGSGAQGAVYRVMLNDTRVLISKRLVPDQSNELRLKTLIAEIQLVSTLHHPSIVLFVGVAWTTPYDLQALYEFMPNGDLRSHLDRTKQQQTQPWGSEKLQIAVGVAEGLAYVHSFNPPIVHRDLKARNILLSEGMESKISDFGVSRSQSEDGTMTTGIGTSRWLAPEVIAGGGTYTEQCDVFSFGVLLVEMETHALPYANTSHHSEVMLLLQVSRGELRPQVLRRVILRSPRLLTSAWNRIQVTDRMH